MEVPKLIAFSSHSALNGKLCVYESGCNVPFSIARVFTVSAMKGDIRGDHSHKDCSQLLICTSGKINVSCDNGFQTFEYILDDMAWGLFIPSGVWAKQEYLTDSAVLMVLCDQSYREDDYVRDYDSFIKSKTNDEG
jgi:dTDP-4-dehydrorhamnose 3,5-epimerase-like enzyme